MAARVAKLNMLKYLPMKVAKSLIALCAIGLIFYASRYLLANLYANQVEYSLGSWQLSAPTQLSQVDAIIHSAEQANQLHPDHPHYLTLAAKAWQWRYLVSGASDSSALHQGLALYRQALTLRPNWANNHADVVRAKLWLGELDSEFNQAFMLADKYGAMTPAVHQVLAEAGLLSWPMLDKTQRQITTAHVALGLLHRKSRTAVIDFLTRHQRLAYGCALARNKAKSDPMFHSWQLPNACQRKK